MVAVEFSEQQKRELYDTGLVRLPGIVPQELVQQALRDINASLGTRGIDPAQLETYRSRTYCPELTRTASVTDLYTRSPLCTLAASAIGHDGLQAVTSGQIALRFPSMGPAQRPTPHIDGMYTPNNGVPQGTIANFTALVGVFLSAIPRTFMGNFSVWPGSHHRLEHFFRNNGPESLLQGMPDIDLGDEEQITAGPGDAVLCHYQLAHGIAGNSSPAIRYAIFFRLFHVDHERVHWECMTDVWTEWAGMRELVPPK